MRFVAGLLLILITATQPILGQVYVPIGLARLSPSARAHGLSESGVSLGDPGFQSINPATIGLVGLEKRVAVSFTPVYSRPLSDAFEFTSQLYGSMMGSLAVTKWDKTVKAAFGVEYSAARMRLPYFSWAIEDSGRSRSMRHSITASFGRRGKVDIAVGGSINFLDFSERRYFSNGKQTVDGGNGLSYDVGAIVRYPGFRASDRLKIVPAVGISYTALGQDLVYKWPSWGLEDDIMKLDRRLQWGGSVALKHSDGDSALSTILLTADQVRRYDEDLTTYHLGFEIDYLSLLSGRLGAIATDGGDPVHSWGVSIVPTTLVRRLIDGRSAGGPGGFLNQIEMSIDYCQYAEPDRWFVFNNGHFLNVNLAWRY